MNKAGYLMRQVENAVISAASQFNMGIQGNIAGLPHDIYNVIGLQRILWRNLFYAVPAIGGIGPVFFIVVWRVKHLALFIMQFSWIELNILSAFEQLGNFWYKQIICIPRTMRDDELIQKIVVVSRRKKDHEGRQGTCNARCAGLAAPSPLKQESGGKGQQHGKERN